MEYKKVKIEDTFSSKSTVGNKKIIFFEYIFYTIISIIMAAYYTINLGIICYKLAEKYDFNLDGLTKGYSFLGGYRDLSDFQWKYYRENIGLILVFASLFVLIGKAIKSYSSKGALKYFYLVFGLSYAFFLHRLKMIYLIIVLLISYSLCVN